MKTKSLLLAALVVLGAFTAVAGNDPNKTGLATVNSKPGVYKLIYEGEKSTTVTLTIFNSNGRVVYTETLHNIKGFIRPVNFNGMYSDTYTIQVTSENQKAEAKVDYAKKSRMVKDSGDPVAHQ